MNERPHGPVDDELLAAFVEGELSASERAAIEVALSQDAALRRRVTELERVRSALSRPVQELEEFDLAGAVRSRIEAPERSLSRRGALYAGAGLAAATALWLGLRAPSVAEPSEAFRAKGGPATRGSTERWTALRVHRARDGEAPELITRPIARDGGLLFSYTNRAEAPFEYLMVFGVDARGAVYWFHPAYERLGDDPRSTPIQAGVADELLPEVVRHDLSSGTLVLRALFTRRPLGVLSVEAWVAKKRAQPNLALPAEGHLQIIELEVAP